MKNENIPVCLSIGVIARNGENSIQMTLESLFQQSVFAKLSACSGQCEVLCLAYGCTDRTVAIAREVLGRMEQRHPHPQAFTARVVEIPEAGNNPWNLFVHEWSAPEARYLYVMDDDIVFYDADIIYKLAGTLDRHPSANVSASRHYKDVLFRPRKPAHNRVFPAAPSLAGSPYRCSGGQLYCLRALVARRIHPPRDPGLVDDGFLRAAFSTDFFVHAPDASRIVFVPDVVPIPPAPVSPRIKKLPVEERAELLESLKFSEKRDPDWQEKDLYCWRQAVARFFRRPVRRLWKLAGLRKVVRWPAMAADFAATTIDRWRAIRFLKKENEPVAYRPKGGSRTILPTPPIEAK